MASPTAPQRQRPERTVKPVDRLSYDQLGGPEQGRERDDDAAGTDVEDMDIDEEVQCNPFDDPTRNEYETDDGSTDDDGDDVATEETATDDGTDSDDDDSDIYDQLESDSDDDEPQ